MPVVAISCGFKSHLLHLIQEDLFGLPVFLFAYIVFHKFSYNKFPPPNTGGGTHTASLYKYFTLQILTFKLFLRHRFSKIISLNQLYFHTLYDLILSVMFYTLYAYSNPDCLCQLCNKLNKSI